LTLSNTLLFDEKLKPLRFPLRDFLQAPVIYVRSWSTGGPEYCNRYSA